MLVGAALAGCRSEPDCRLETLVDDYLSSSEVSEYVDCGHISETNQDPSLYYTAHDCVLREQANQQTFITLWYRQGIEGVVRRAYVGITRDGTYQLTDFAQGFHGDASLTPTRQSRCSEFVDLGSCSDIAGELCLDCTAVTFQDCP